jgi:hypothetical protein
MVYPLGIAGQFVSVIGLAVAANPRCRIIDGLIQPDQGACWWTARWFTRPGPVAVVFQYFGLYQ